MSDITLAASANAFQKLFEDIVSGFSFSKSDTATYGPFSASYAVDITLSGGSVALNNNDTIDVSDLEIVFDTVKTSRKYPNLKKNPRVAWVIGCTTEITVQCEGIAEELAGDDLAKYKKTYFAAFPEGPARESWPGITYFVVRPKWVRYCDYDPSRRRIVEKEF